MTFTLFKILFAEFLISNEFIFLNIYILLNRERHFDFKGQFGAFPVCLRGLWTCMLNYTRTDLLYVQ